MKIKNRLALYYTLISSGLLLVMMVCMYIAFGYFFRNDFYGRINDRAKIAAQVYLEADEISSDSLNHVQQRMVERLPGEVIRVYNDKNQASFIKDESQYWGAATINQVRQAKSLNFTNGDRQTVGIYYPDNQGNFVILASAIDIQSRARLMRIAQVMVVTFLLVNSLLFFIGRWLAAKSLLPVVKLAREMTRISASQLHFRADEGNGTDETSSLAQSFNRLLQHLQNSFELQQTFVANASHELRTPLTSITGEIELALNRRRSIEDYETLLRSVLVDTNRLTDTVNSLMELAQTDMEYTRADVEPVRMDELLWELQAHWANKPFVADVQQLPENQQLLLVQANKNLLMIAFNNIIGNAFKFSNDQPVTCTLQANGDQICFIISDQGIGIPEEDLADIFTPFYRGDNTQPFHGNGIGLYMAYMIIILFNGQITVSSKLNNGTAVEIRFYPIQ